MHRLLTTPPAICDQSVAQLVQRDVHSLDKLSMTIERLTATTKKYTKNTATR